MIRNDNELMVVREQLLLIEDALASLRREVFPKNKRNFAVLSEGYVDQIAALRAEIDAYLGVVKDPAPEEVVGVIRSIDLDSQTFVLRDRRDNEPDLLCEYDERIETVAKSSLDCLVLVTGVIGKRRKTKKEKMEVETIELFPNEDKPNPSLDGPTGGPESDAVQT